MKLFRRFTALMLAVTLSLTTFAAAARDWAAVEVADKAGAEASVSLILPRRSIFGAAKKMRTIPAGIVRIRHIRQS